MAGLPGIPPLVMTAHVTWNHETTLRWGLALSLLLHLLGVAVSLVEYLPAPRFSPPPEPAMEVELVKEPPPPPPHPEPPPPPPQPSVSPPEPVPVPQLRPGKPADKSSAPVSRPVERGISEHMVEAHPGPPPGELSESAQDRILAQVLHYWNMPERLAPGDTFTIEMTININKDGTLAGAMHKDAPWNPAAVIRNYNQLPDGYTRRALEAMLLAIRLAQPLKLPPDDGKGWPRHMVIRFRPADL